MGAGAEEEDTIDRTGSGAAICGIGLLLGFPLGAGCSGTEEPGCEVGQILDARSALCVPEDCGPGPWRADPGLDDARRVASWGSDDGDGSAERPLASVERAVEMASGDPDPAVLLGAGTFPTELQIGEDLALVGRCRELTVLEGAEPEIPVLVVGRGDVELRSLALAGAGPGLRVLRPDLLSPPASVVAVDLEIRQVTRYGAFVDGAGSRLRIEDSAIRDVLAIEAGTRGRGVNVQSGGALEAVGLTIDGARDAGIFGHGDSSSVSLADSRIVGTLPTAMGDGGRGLDLYAGVALSASGLVLADNQEFGLHATGEGTRVELEDVEVTGTRPSPGGGRGRGVAITYQAELTGVGLRLEDNTEAGLVILQEATATLADCSIVDTRTGADVFSGHGLVLEDGAVLVADRLRVENSDGHGVRVLHGAALEARELRVEASTEVGVMAVGEGASIDLWDSAIVATAPTVAGVLGHGLEVVDGARASLDGVLAEGNHEVGLLASGPGSLVELSGVEVRDTRPAPASGSGRGLAVQGGARLEATDTRVQGSHELGLFASGVGSELVLRDVQVLDTRVRPDGRWGWGGAIILGAALDSEDLRVEDSHGVGLAVLGAGATASLERTVIERTGRDAGRYPGLGLVVETEAQVDATTLAVRDGAGPGLLAWYDGSLRVEDVLLERNALAGAVVGDGELELEGGRIASTSPSASGGGGTGILAWDVLGPPSIRLRDVVFQDLRYPGLYLRGDGRYEVSGCTFEGCGSAFPATPAGVLAIGVGAWREVLPGVHRGLLMSGCTVASAPSDALLLHASSAVVEGNAFEDVAGLPIRWQECEGVEPPTVDDAELDPVPCQPWAQGIEPVLDFSFDVEEAGLVE